MAKKLKVTAADGIEQFLADMAQKGVGSVWIGGLGYFVASAKTKVFMDKELKTNPEGFRSRAAAALSAEHHGKMSGDPGRPRKYG